MKVVFSAPHWVDESWFQDCIPEQCQAIVWSKVCHALMSGPCTTSGEMRSQWEADNTDDTDSRWSFYWRRQKRTWSVGHFAHEANAGTRVGEVGAQEPVLHPTPGEPSVEFWRAAQYAANLYPRADFP